MNKAFILLILGFNFLYLSYSAFPYGATYPFGTSTLTNDATINAYILAEWTDWKAQHVTTNGAGGYQRIQRDSANNMDTHSIGMGFGMIFAVYFNEQTLFDSLYNYVQTKLNSHQLLNYQMDSSGNVIGLNSATDADMQIAVALIFAHKVWGSAGTINYNQKAMDLLAILQTHNIEAVTNVLQPGDFWGGKDQLQIAHCLTGYLSIIQQFTSDTTWDNAKTKCYNIITQINTQNSNTGLFPEMCTDQAVSLGYSYDYGYQSVRTVFRIATDYIWYGNSNAQTQLGLLNTFVQNIGASNLKDGYSIGGNPIGNNNNAVFVCTHAIGMLALTSDLTTAQSFFTACKNLKDTSNGKWYGNTIRLLALLMTTGNFPNLYSYVAPVLSPTTSPNPSPNPSPVPSPTPNPSPTSTPCKFPYNSYYPFGYSSLASDKTQAATFVTTQYNDWQSTYVTSNGAKGFRRVQRDAGTNFDTVSQGIGYGMWIAVYMDDKTLVEDLYNYAKLCFDARGLMHWQIDSNGNVIGQNAATDADQDIAIALVFADRKWGSAGSVNFKAAAISMINAMMTHQVQANTFVLKPGDVWGGSDVLNPSYFMPAWYRIFSDITGDTQWLKVAEKCYTIADQINLRNSGTGFVPDWCTADGTPANGQGYDYSWDAMRYPLRLAVDYSWFGTSKARSNCNKITQTWQNKGIPNIKVPVSITGGDQGGYHNSYSVSTQAAGAMTYDLDRDFATLLYSENRQVQASGSYHYFGNTLRMITLLYTTGNMPNIMACDANNNPAPPAPPPPTTPTPTPPPPTTTPTTPTPTTNNNNLGGSSKCKFPYNAQYPYGLSSLATDQGEINAFVQAQYNSWKEAHVTSSGAAGFRRVQRDAGSDFDTVSEGIAYGMWIAVYMDDQSLVDDLYKYCKKYFDARGLMNWRISKNGEIWGANAASDADQDIAVSLIFAHLKWGSAGAINYEQEAKNMITAMMTHEVEANTYFFKPGDVWGGSSVQNPSYYMMPWFRIFADFTGDSRWLKVIQASYQVIEAVNQQNSGTGFVPDWCQSNGEPADGMGYNYYYDAMRFPLRSAFDYSWYGEIRAKINVNKINNFWKNQGVQSVKDGYTIFGSQISSYHSATAVSTQAGGVLTYEADPNFAKAFFNQVRIVQDSGTYTYFGNTLRMITLLYLSGNMPNLYTCKSQTTTTTPNPTPIPTTSNPSVTSSSITNSTKTSNINKCPFPYNFKYKFGLPSQAFDQNEANQFLTTEYSEWKQAHVTTQGASGYRRVQTDQSGDFNTFSEGIGYGMWIAVYMDDRDLVDDLYRYCKQYFDQNGLMHWNIDRNGRVIGQNAATDADQDIAVSLVFAHMKWGSTSGAVDYQTEAIALIKNMMKHEVQENTFVLQPGDVWGGSDTTNPSYFMPAWYRIFSAFTGDLNWLKVVDSCYQISENFNQFNQGTGLAPDWCDSQGKPSQQSGRGYNYYYDAMRYPMRTSIDFSWYGEKNAEQFANLINEFWVKVTIPQVHDGYQITGEENSPWHSAAIVSTSAAGTMSFTQSPQFAQEFYTEVRAVKATGAYTYFGNTLRMITLLYMTGNMPNLFELDLCGTQYVPPENLGDLASSLDNSSSLVNSTLNATSTSSSCKITSTKSSCESSIYHIYFSLVLMIIFMLIE